MAVTIRGVGRLVGVDMQEHTCPVCSAKVPSKGVTGPRATYCSSRCRNRADYLRRRDVELAKKAAQNAEIRARVTKECPGCGERFSPARTMKQKFCSRRCSAEHRGPDSLTRTCEEPGCDRPYRARGMCHMHWRRVARAEGREKLPVWDERRRDAWKARQSLGRGAAEAETFSYQGVFDRDGWVCGLCHEPVDAALEYPDPLCKSLDHIVPLSRGGSHTRENSQLAHLSCNVRKGNRAELTTLPA